MFIKESFINLTTKLNIGKFAYFLNIDKHGANIDFKELIIQTEHYSYIVIYGDEPFEQREELAKYLRKIVKLNPDVVIEIHTKGLIKPLGVQSITNIKYYVNLQLKSTGIEYNKRIKKRIVTWYNEMFANFVFYILDENDFDEVELLVQQYAIKKSQITIMPHTEIDLYKDGINLIVDFCKSKGYNFSFDTERI